jgi:hypothetical protein
MLSAPENLDSGQVVDFEIIADGVMLPPVAVFKPKFRTVPSEVSAARETAAGPRSVEPIPTVAAPEMSFAEAVEAMRAGKAVRRACGRRLYVFIAEQGQRFSDALGCTVFMNPDDIFATDWLIAGEAFGRR